MYREGDWFVDCAGFSLAFRSGPSCATRLLSQLTLSDSQIEKRTTSLLWHCWKCDWKTFVLMAGKHFFYKIELIRVQISTRSKCDTLSLSLRVEQKKSRVCNGLDSWMTMIRFRADKKKVGANTWKWNNSSFCSVRKYSWKWCHEFVGKEENDVISALSLCTGTLIHYRY
jgi:hypothetical protein